MTRPFSDFVPAPNIGRHPAVYEEENQALARDGRLAAALWEAAPWVGKSVVDLGCGTGFWMPSVAREAREVVGIEPDPTLLAAAQTRIEALPAALRARCRAQAGSAESPGLPPGSVDIIHARWAYFFGPRAAPGLAAMRTLLAPGGTFIAVDNAWTTGPPRSPGQEPPPPFDFTWLLRHATGGNASMDPSAAAKWWEREGAEQRAFDAAWLATDRDQLARILRIEFPRQSVDRFLALHRGHRLDYRMVLSIIRKPA